MLSFALSHVTDEQGINSAMMLCGEGASGAYRLSKWGIKRAWNKRKSRRSTGPEQADPLVSDACSAYRGGYTSTDNPENSTLLRDLSGKTNFPGNGEKPFFWTGEKDDLSWFWKKTERNTSVILPVETIDEIPEESLRARVRSTMEQARLDGLVDKVSKSYVLTDKGQKEILDPEFIRRRLIKECNLYADACENLDERRKELENDRIDRKLEELGRTKEFEGCDRITLNKKKLLADDTAENVVRFYVPSTARKKAVDIPKADLIELDDMTFAAFLRKGQTYFVNGEPISEAELFASFENKNNANLIRTTVARAEASAAKEMGIAGYDDPEAFFEAALRAGMEGETLQTKAATEEAVAEAGTESLAGDEEIFPEVGGGLDTGDSAYVIFPEGPDHEAEVVPYKVDHTVNTKDGRHLYLVPEDPTRGDLLLPAEAEDHLVFSDNGIAEMQIILFPEEVQEYEKFLQVQTTPVSVPESRLNVRSSQIEQTENGFLLHPKDAPFEAVQLDAKDVELLPDGSANICLRPDATYTVTSGDVSYSVSGDGAEHLLKDVSKPVRETAQGIKATETAAATAKTAVETAQKTAEAAAELTTDAAAAVPGAGQALKVGEKVAGAGLGAVSAVNGLAAGDAKALVEAAAKAVPGAEVATKLGGLTQKL